MKVKFILPALAMFLFVAGSFASASAQVIGNSQICKICAPKVQQINIFPSPWSCRTKVFGANTSGYGKCKTLGYDWSTSDPGASITPVGGQAMVNFSGPGIYTVCVTYTKWFDLNNNNTYDPGEGCSDTECITVEVCL